MNYIISNTITTLENLKVGFGPVFFKKNIVLLNSNQYSSILDNVLFFIDLAKKKIDKSTIQNAIRQSEDTFEICAKNDIKIISINDLSYPKQLLDIKNPPPTLYYRGNLKNLTKVATIIGTREPNERGQIIAERISSHYNKQGFSICNGLAEGIDTNAIKYENTFHKNTIGILGGGLNYLNHKTILKTVASNADNILENDGLLLTEFQPNKKEDTFSVIKSCRIQAGIAHGLILIQSSIDGGSKYTIKAFSELNRTLGVINPTQQDYNDINYAANRILIENSINGLSKFIDAKPEKILLKNILAIKTKDNYSDFEQLIKNQNQKKQEENLLFNF